MMEPNKRSIMSPAWLNGLDEDVRRLGSISVFASSSRPDSVLPVSGLHFMAQNKELFRDIPNSVSNFQARRRRRKKRCFLESAVGS